MKLNINPIKNIALVLLLLVVPTEAFASGGGGGFPWVTWAANMFNFAVFVGILVYFGGPKIQDYFADRQKTLVADLDESKRLREEAEEKFEEYSTRLEKLDGEREALLDEYHRQGEDEKNRLIEDAKKQVEKMRADAELVIQQEMRRAVAAIEEQAVDLAIALAEGKLAEKVDSRAQGRIVDAYVTDLNELEAATGA